MTRLVSSLDIALRLPISFWERVRVQSDECWVWSGTIQSNGYGSFHVRKKTLLVHRLAYSALVGEIPHGLHLDHLCRVRSCVNPAHLEAVTCGENTRRSTAPEAARRRHAAVTHCPQGHDYTPENTKMGPHGRTCRACANAFGREYMRRKRAALRPVVPK